ncbi:hypothetical protein cyc_03500 [Cyclospora cayetanensis]|uniref:Uncharacterized protein n=1 Tax=Cyclospora cayetanensis TaxID=88456 RepID=A0A1D3CRW9_9EIME|nr:hypothetical protein cyc_03500 [Cyclospora cayetanensis]
MQRQTLPLPLLFVAELRGSSSSSAPDRRVHDTQQPPPPSGPFQPQPSALERIIHQKYREIPSMAPPLGPHSHSNNCQEPATDSTLQTPAVSGRSPIKCSPYFGRQCGIIAILFDLLRRLDSL